MNGIESPRPAASVRAQYDLTDRVAIVTGGAGFLGVQHAEALAEMGAIPVLLDLDRTRLEAAAARVKSATNGRCETATADITDAASLRAATDAVLDRHGRIDVLVNNAAPAICRRPRSKSCKAESGKRKAEISFASSRKIMTRFWRCRA